MSAVGDNGPLTIWNAWEITNVRQRFSPRLDSAIREDAEARMSSNRDDDAMSDDE